MGRIDLTTGSTIVVYVVAQGSVPDDFTILAGVGVGDRVSQRCG
jgi:hypothetical protein